MSTAIVQASSVRATRAAMAVLAVAVAGAGCFYSDPINQRPAAIITSKQPTELHRGDMLTLTGEARDPDDDGWHLTWRLTACDASLVRCETLDSVSGTSVNRVIPGAIVGGPLVERILVELDATDELGARSLVPARETVIIANARPKAADITKVWRSFTSAFPVDVPIEITFRISDLDGETADIAVSSSATRDGFAEPDKATPLALRPGDPADAVRFQFRPAKAGDWKVTFALRDGIGDVTEVEVPLVIHEDEPPCVEAFVPAFTGPLVVDAPRRFAALSVTDDKDEYPLVNGDPDLGAATFRWSMTAPGGTVYAPVTGATGPELLIDPARYAPGDRFEVRVDAGDRITTRPACPADDPACSHAASNPSATCRQRVTWKVEIR
jgi:hypothetical protein